MVAEQEIADFLRQGYRDVMPQVVTDCVIFGFHDGELKVLLLQWKHLRTWSLPGGHIMRSESVDEAAHRMLKERTGLDQIFLRQYYTFGGLDRKEWLLKDLHQTLHTQAHLTVDEDFWLAERIISIGYYALVEFTRVTPTPDFLSEECRWWNMQERPPLMFDHDQMVDKALQALRMLLDHRPIGINLLPETFTMPELQKLYETILGRTLDRRNFQKKMLGLGILERLKERRRGGAHKSPYLYRFDREMYDRAVNEGLSFGF